MRRSALARCFSIVGCLLAAHGCDGLKTPLDNSQPPPPPPPKCASTTDANGQVCTTCWDSSTGKMISNACVSGSTGSATPGGDMCTTITDGGPGSCASYDDWKQYAVDRCAKQNLQLTGITPGPSCDGGNYQSISYTCCPGTPTPPPPPPPKCASTTDASGQICRTCWDPVTGNMISNDCMTGSTGDGGTCTTIDDGGATSCKPYYIWKQYGADRCAQQNMQLTDLTLGPSCGADSYQSVTYTCCATTPPPGSTGTGGAGI